MTEDLRRAATSPVIAVVGPTASGKSAVADLVAEALGSEVVSADAMQVYRGMDIGTAKTPVSERRVPLLLVDVADPTEPYSAALYQRDSRRAIDRLRAEGRVPVLCGGTGLYVRAALDEMEFPRGEVDGAARQRYQDLAGKLGPEGVHALLAERDPESAALIHPHNVRRVVRALEMLDEGVSYARQSAGFSEPREHYPSLQFALTMDRARLYARIDARVDAMMSAGLLDEVRGLMDAGAADALTSRQAIGYKELIDALEGRCTIGEAVDLIKLRSRRYAKRQLSWFRRDPRITWLDMDVLDADGAARLIVDALDGR
ncbi:tRNA (adenosine(37)-N6)-dimethylallyltransferase MiaA [Candidatus Collinsella stercoripullorum]|uniref:tRNA (adenosine(37)-N6)-dimethylallyltransferase MiaA n=1 Tax=Candidatus Collinsella stercoripullorum TaxID=2838522 RepID=UPI001C3A1900|nr:tRNA (adenosine(37)-N6)-dimethylallyltransferase MiaA [Candidatus Collinsella stercoripullorum]HJA01371.1 tRNA (adenosine(37)-N6)-dimethylallyltransferase MiaA [Candidatus Collinsella stercoripullorum]